MSTIQSILLKGVVHTITLPVFSAKPTDEFILRSGTGFGPPEVDIGLSPTPPMGSSYMGSHPRDREIVLLIRMNPDYTGPNYRAVSELRALLYRLMGSNVPITIIVNTDSTDTSQEYVPSTMQTTGHIRRIETAPFAKDTDIQVTLACEDAVFVAPTVMSIVSDLPKPILYNASAPTGFTYSFILRANVAGTLSLRTHQVLPYTEMATLPATAALKANDILKFDTRPLLRKITVTRAADGKVVDLTGLLDLSSKAWPQLHPGNNTVTVLEGGTALNPQPITDMFTYTKQYWGV